MNKAWQKRSAFHTIVAGYVLSEGEMMVKRDLESRRAAAFACVTPTKHRLLKEKISEGDAMYRRRLNEFCTLIKKGKINNKAAAIAIEASGF